MPSKLTAKEVDDLAKILECLPFLAAADLRFTSGFRDSMVRRGDREASQEQLDTSMNHASQEQLDTSNNHAKKRKGRASQKQPKKPKDRASQDRASKKRVLSETLNVLERGLVSNQLVKPLDMDIPFRVADTSSKGLIFLQLGGHVTDLGEVFALLDPLVRPHFDAKENPSIVLDLRPLVYISRQMARQVIMRYVELLKPGMTNKKKAKLCVIKSRNTICNASMEEAFFATRTDLSGFRNGVLCK